MEKNNDATNSNAASEFLIRHSSSTNIVLRVPLFPPKKTGSPVVSTMWVPPKRWRAGWWGWNPWSFSGPNTSNLPPSHHGPNGHSFSIKCGSDPPRRQRADGHSFASPQAVDVIFFSNSSRTQMLCSPGWSPPGLRPPPKETVHEPPVPPPGAIRFKCIPGEQGCLSSPACVVQLQLDRGVMSASLYFI